MRVAKAGRQQELTPLLKIDRPDARQGRESGWLPRGAMGAAKVPGTAWDERGAKALWRLMDAGSRCS
jgi:hypothetical protein